MHCLPVITWSSAGRAHGATILQAGLDSLGAVDLRNALAARFDVRVPATIIFDYPTIAALTEFLMANASASADQVMLAAACWHACIHATGPTAVPG